MLAEASFHSSDYAAPRVEGHRAGRRLQRSRWRPVSRSPSRCCSRNSWWLPLSSKWST